MWMAAGNWSLDENGSLTSSFGCTDSPRRSAARVASTSLVFMFEDVPEPVWKTSIGNSASQSPRATSAAASAIAFALASSSRPCAPRIVADAPLIDASVKFRSRSMGRPEIGKFSTARWVWARHLACFVTRTSPIESFSIRKPALMRPAYEPSGLLLRVALRRLLAVALRVARLLLLLLLPVPLLRVAAARHRLHRVGARRRPARRAVAERLRGLLGGVGHWHGDHRRAVRAQLGPGVGHLGRVEAHRDHRVAALGPRGLEHAAHHLVAAVDEVARHALQLPAEHRLQPGAELGERVPRPDGQPEDLPAHPLDLPAGDVLGRHHHHVGAPPWFRSKSTAEYARS